jgi:hypothetical protein
MCREYELVAWPWEILQSIMDIGCPASSSSSESCPAPCRARSQFRAIPRVIGTSLVASWTETSSKSNQIICDGVRIDGVKIALLNTSRSSLANDKADCRQHGSSVRPAKLESWSSTWPVRFIGRFLRRSCPLVIF